MQPLLVCGSGSGSGVWRALGRFNGAVRCIARLGNDLYAGGYFSSVDGTAALYVARLASGRWGALPGGWVLDGGVNAMITVRDCLHLGGAFTTALGGMINISCAGTSQWCARKDGLENVFDVVSGGGGSSAVRSLILA
uniref:Uncharacterized protein n=1 Tax=Cryptomonas curvata TaxID=233186 RepID=A0A7S0MTT0_9CRYP|mmetsp:Transcript_5303/g.11762  ORF Transcript_5303/g.11762 Transcript_5303/m.11762 type:complete len:138 (+) Transcript_5303:148-561(+)